MSAGDFTPVGKMKSSIKENVLVYLSLGVVAAVVAVYIMVDQGMSGHNLKLAVMQASNMWGLLMVIVLLGYGLVDVPRRIWYQVYTEYTLRTSYFRASKLSTEISDAQIDEDEIEEQIKSVAGVIKASDPTRRFVDMLLSRAKLDTIADFSDFKGDEEMNDPTITTLVKLHKRLIKTKRVVNRCQCQWNALMDRIFDLQDTIENTDSADRLYRKSLGEQPRFPAALWLWKIQAMPWILRISAVTCAVMSAILLWSEVTFRGKDPVLSVYALAVLAAGANADYVSTEFLTFVLLLYLCVCTYIVVFRIRLFNFFYLVPNRQTDSSSMLFSAMILSRLTAPICLNFLSMVHMDSHISNTNSTKLTQETEFTKVQGHMDVFNQFNAYYSIVVVLLALLAVFKVGNRLMSCLGMQRFVEDDDDTDDLVKEGKMYVNRERRRRERSNNSYADFSVSKEKMFDKREAERAADPVRSRTGLGRSRPTKRVNDAADSYDAGSNSLADAMDFDDKRPASRSARARSPVAKKTFGGLFGSRKVRLGPLVLPLHFGYATPSRQCWSSLVCNVRLEAGRLRVCGFGVWIYSTKLKTMNDAAQKNNIRTLSTLATGCVCLLVG